MRCPKCGSRDDKVIDSRQSRDSSSIRRRRECLKCKYRFTTYEEIERSDHGRRQAEGGAEASGGGGGASSVAAASTAEPRDRGAPFRYPRARRPRRAGLR